MPSRSNPKGTTVKAYSVLIALLLCFACSETGSAPAAPLTSRAATRTATSTATAMGALTRTQTSTPESTGTPTCTATPFATVAPKRFQRPPANGTDGSISPRGEPPVAVVQAVMVAYETLDVWTAQTYFCDSLARPMADAWERDFVQIEASGIDPQELLGVFSFNTRALAYEETLRDESSAEVRIFGPVWMNVDGDKLASFLRKAAVAQGRAVDEDEIGVLVTLFSAMAGQETPVDSSVRLIKKGTNWLVCDRLDFLNEFGGFDLPLHP